MSLIFLLSLAGFLTSYYIYFKKKKEESLVCISGHDCGVVVKSKYSLTFGISNEILGIAYFLLIMVMALLLFPRPALAESAIFFYGLKIISGLAAVFSLYLTGIQIFKLKEFCLWCFCANFINLLIFIVVMLII